MLNCPYQLSIFRGWMQFWIFQHSLTTLLGDRTKKSSPIGLKTGNSGILEDEHGNYRRYIVKVLKSRSQLGGICWRWPKDLSPPVCDGQHHPERPKTSSTMTPPARGLFHLGCSQGIECVPAVHGDGKLVVKDVNSNSVFAKTWEFSRKTASVVAWRGLWWSRWSSYRWLWLWGWCWCWL